MRKHDQQTYPRPSADGSKIVLDSIVELPGSPLTVQQQRIDHLVLNIAAVGLKQPLVVVAGNRLVNGRHRLHALRALRERDPQEFLALFPDAMIPVHVVPLDGRTEAEVMSALQVAEAPMQVDFTKPSSSARSSTWRSRAISGKSAVLGRASCAWAPRSGTPSARRGRALPVHSGWPATRSGFRGKAGATPPTRGR